MKRTDGVDVGTPSDHAAAKRQRVMDEGPLDEFQGLKGHLLVEAVFGKYGARHRDHSMAAEWEGACDQA